MNRDFPSDRPVSPAWLTVPLARAYGWAAAWDQKQQSATPPYRPPMPVISVGNITVGGSGKTPCVMALARLIGEIEPRLAEPRAMAVLSRGYGRESRELVAVEPELDYKLCGDEPLLIRRALPNVSVVVHADRRLAARFAVEKLGARLLILDDGFQHRRLARDMDLVLVDGAAPLGNGYLLPAGPLRESATALKRATAIIGVGDVAAAASALAERFGKPFAQARPQIQLPERLAGTRAPVFVLSGIARPERLVRMLEDAGLQIVGQRAFRDHHRFTAEELHEVAALARAAGARHVVTTAKDRVRIPTWSSGIPLQVADLWLDIGLNRIVQGWLEQIVKRATYGV